MTPRRVGTGTLQCLIMWRWSRSFWGALRDRLSDREQVSFRLINGCTPCSRQAQPANLSISTEGYWLQVPPLLRTTLEGRASVLGREIVPAEVQIMRMHPASEPARITNCRFLAT